MARRFEGEMAKTQMHHRVITLFVAVAASLTLSIHQATAQAQFELVTDLTPGMGPDDLFHPSDNGGSIILGGATLFRGCDGVHGCELWRSDGTSVGTEMLVDLAPGPAGGMLRSHFPTLDGLAYFVGANAAGTYQLWRSDGTAAGTEVVVGRIGPSTSLTVYGGLLWFQGWDEVNGAEPWISDGTPAGTRLLVDLEPGPGDSDPELFTGAGSLVYFSAFTSASGTELFASDGTGPGTFLVTEIEPGPNGSSPENLTAFGTLLLLSATETTSGNEVWRSDGSAAGTFRIDINPGGGGSFPSFFGEVDGAMLFRATDGSTGYELWKTNGTTALQVVDLRTGSLSGVEDDALRHGDFVYFRGNDGSSGEELWRSDGTAGGTILVADITTGSGSSSPASFLRVGNRLFYSAEDGVHGRELWTTNSSGSQSQMVVDLDNASTSSLDDANTLFPGPADTLLFPGQVAPLGRELWRTDGTPGGTLRLTDATEPLPTYALELTPWQGGLALRPSAGPRGQLVTTNGTEAGTFVHEFLFGEFSLDTLVEWNGDLYLSDWNTDTAVTRLWGWDGANETLLAEDSSGDGFTLFAADSGVVLLKGGRLHLSDGTVSVSFVPLELASPPAVGKLWVDGDTALYQDTTDLALWTTDLVNDTSQLIVDPTPNDERWERMLGMAGGRLFFTIYTAFDASPAALYVWATNGTTAGSEPVLTLPWNTIVHLAAIGGQPHLLTSAPPYGTWQLHSTDGTAAGTALVTSGPGQPEYSGGVVSRDAWLAFATSEGVWLSDGSSGGTRVIPNTIGFEVHQALDGWAVVSGLQDGRGVEFALLDPGTGSLVELPEIEAGVAGTSVHRVLVSGDRLWTSAFRSDTGYELFVLDLSEWLMPSSQSLFADGFESGGTSVWSQSIP
jgi:ELWxxDGT repeat protein